MFEILNESVSQKDKFRIAANKLLNNCFVIKKKEDTRKEYMFINQNREMFTTYFELLGYQLQINEEQGVIGLVNQYGAGRLQLSKYESIMLLIFRLLYLEKRKELGTYSEEVTVLVEEVREKYAMLKVKAEPVLKKEKERNIMSLFRRFNLAGNIESDVTQADTRIIIYPSIIMAIQMDDINHYYELVQSKLKDYAKGEADGDSEEITDENQIS